MISDDGLEMQFIVAVRNLGMKVWSSHSGNGAGLEINVGSHIYAEGDKCLNFENNRSPIPFVLGPGEEILVPIRFSTDWLAHGASRVDVELVQESVGWFGDPLRLSLTQPLNAGPISRSIGTISDIVGIAIRSPYRIESYNSLFVTLLLINRSYNFVDFSNISGRDIEGILNNVRPNLNNASFSWQSGMNVSVKSMSDHIDPAGFGLMTVFYSLL